MAEENKNNEDLGFDGDASAEAKTPDEIDGNAYDYEKKYRDTYAHNDFGADRVNDKYGEYNTDKSYADMSNSEQQIWQHEDGRLDKLFPQSAVPDDLRRRVPYPRLYRQGQQRPERLAPGLGNLSYDTRLLQHRRILRNERQGTFPAVLNRSNNLSANGLFGQLMAPGLGSIFCLASVFRL